MLAGLWEEAGGAGLAHPTAGLTVAGAHSGGPPSEFPAVCGELGLPASGAERRGRVVIVKHDAAATGWAEGRHEPAPLSLLAGPSVHLRPRETPPPPTQLNPGVGTEALPWFPLPRAGMRSDFSHQGRKVGGTEWESEAQRWGLARATQPTSGQEGARAPPQQALCAPAGATAGDPMCPDRPSPECLPQRSGTGPPAGRMVTDRWCSNCPRGGLSGHMASFAGGTQGRGDPPLQWPQSGRSSPEYRTLTPFACKAGLRPTAPGEVEVGSWGSCGWVAAHAHPLPCPCSVLSELRPQLQGE